MPDLSFLPPLNLASIRAVRKLRAPEAKAFLESKGYSPDDAEALAKALAMGAKFAEDTPTMRQHYRATLFGLGVSLNKIAQLESISAQAVAQSISRWLPSVRFPLIKSFERIEMLAELYHSNPHVQTLPVDSAILELLEISKEGIEQ